MLKLKETTTRKATAFIDYKPAELRINSQWLIVYYCVNPVSKELERQRVTVPVMKSKTERLKYAKKIVLEINKKLECGWLPYYDVNSASEYKTFDFCSEKFIKEQQQELQQADKRKDTVRSYVSFVNMIKKYIHEKQPSLKLMIELNQHFVFNYLDWIYYERQNSARTYNNHLAFLGTFFNYCIKRGYIKEDFTNGISKKKNPPKKRQILTDDVKGKIRKLEHTDFNFYVACMLTYFCFIRRTELTKLKVSDVNLKNGFITIDQNNSKNVKTENVTIPNHFLPVLAQHLVNASSDDFLFSDDSFKAGKIQLNPKKVSDAWTKQRKRLGFSNEFQFYSLKDTGITDLLNTGIPAIKVRDQARHHDLKITESYTSRNKNADELVRNSDFNF